ncbi:hypothetical protein [Bizionia echini]|uniref:hypothetical protein n=1 Tax=Bizionia echini TaxID=649333 RepID=UPI0011600B72|nr:hypothetical protein [Bizionia echini]
MLTLGVVILALGLMTSLYLLVSPSSHDYFTGSEYFKVPYFLFLCIAIFVAPITEELSFRGGFNKSKSIRIISIIGLFVFLLLSESLLLKTLMIIYIALLIVSFYRKPNTLVISLYVGNALLFSLFHLDLEQFFTISSLQGFLFRFAFTFFSIWICINFNLLKSIIFHAAWNFVLMALLSIGLFFPNETIHEYENEMIKVTWQRASKTSNSIVNFNTTSENVIEAKGCNVIFLLKSTEWNLSSKDSLIEFVPTEPYMDYKIDMKIKDTSNTNQNLYTLVRTFLSESDLIKLRTK